MNGTVNDARREGAAARRESALRAAVEWARTIHLLMVREVRSRFSADPLGYVWAFLTPIMWIASIAFIFGYIGRQTPIHTDINSFLMAGMLPYIVFRTTITSIMRAVKAQRYMVFFAGIRPNDLLIATALLELVNSILLYALLMAGNYVFFGHFEMDSPLVAFSGFILAWALGASFGHMAAAFAMLTEAAVRIIPIILRPMFWLSGIFYVANEVPGMAIEWLRFNPLLQAIEIIRNGVFADYASRIADVSIPLAFIVAMNLAASALKLHVTGYARDE